MASKLAISINEFALDLYRKVGASSPDDVFLSPFSISTVMAMVYLGSKGETSKQMYRTLKIENILEVIHETFEDYIKLINAENANFTLTTANRLYPSIKYEILDEYITTCFKQYNTDVVPADYVEKASDVRNEINSWVEKETKGKIKNIIPPRILDPRTVLVVVNAIYFKGDWATKFQPEKTVVKPFYKIGADRVRVSMMKSKMKGAMYGKDRSLNCKALQLPYKGEDLYMLVLLPNKKDGLPALESKLSLTTLEYLQNNMSPELVKVSLPKFKIEASFELSKALRQIGMPDALDPNKADFTRMAKVKGVFLSKVFHQGFIEVNEEGTEAAAATAAVLAIKSRSKPVTHSFDADHPFLFFIIDKRSGVILFQGRLRAPTEVDAKTGQ